MSKELEEALNGLASYIMYTDDNSDESASAIEWHNTIKKYITQQEKKDERAKKVEEMLDIYKRNDQIQMCLNDRLRLIEIEKELEEMK